MGFYKDTAKIEVILGGGGGGNIKVILGFYWDTGKNRGYIGAILGLYLGLYWDKILVKMSVILW